MNRFGIAGLFTALCLMATSIMAAPSPFVTVTATDHVLGNPKAPVTLIEYGSVACPACAIFNEEVMPQIKAKYIDTGKVRYVFRPMLTGVPSIAVAGTRLAECAGKNRYFAVIDAVMRGQKDYYAMGENNMLARPSLLKIAQSFGFNEARFNACAGDAAGLKHLQDLQAVALNAGVGETPTVFINGKKMEDNTLAEVEKAISTAK